MLKQPRTCNIYKREIDVTFLEARTVMESYMKVNTYAKGTHKTSPVSGNDHHQIGKLMYMGLNNRPKFQEQLKKLYSAKICQKEPQIKQKEPTTNTHTIIPKVSLENPISPNKTNIVKEKFPKSLIHPPIPKIDNPGKTHMIKPLIYQCM